MKVRDFTELCKQYTAAKQEYQQAVGVESTESAAQKMREARQKIEKSVETAQKIVGDDPTLGWWADDADVENYIRVLAYHASWILVGGGW